MKKLILAAIAALLCTVSAPAADWVDQGDGTWTCSVTVTASTTTEKDMFEQIRAHHNYLYRTTENELDASEWLAGILSGFTNRAGDVVEKWCAGLWKAFKRQWVSPMAFETSVDNGDTEALAVSVPPPPAP